MKLKKQYISSIFTILAMVLLLISRFTSKRPIDWLGYIAIAIIVASIVSLIWIYKESK